MLYSLQLIITCGYYEPIILVSKEEILAGFGGIVGGTALFLCGFFLVYVAKDIMS